MASDLSLLACGLYHRHPTVGRVLENIGNNITIVENRILELPKEADDYISLHGPFYGRTLLESVCIALVGRIDPFRLLVIKKVQESGDFGLGSRSKIAMKWSGDIVEEGMGSEALKKMWRPDLEFQKASRGLLGDYYGNLFWNPAYQGLLDATADSPSGDCLADYRASTMPDYFTTRVRSDAFRLFSALSKGVHGELVIKADLIYDKVTVLELLSETMKLCGILSIASHMLDSALCQMYLCQAIELYKKVKEGSDSYAAR